MKLLSYQSDSLYAHGGNGRVLRRFYSGHESDITCLYPSEYGRVFKGPVKEIAINCFPLQKDWMKWKVRSFFNHLRFHTFFERTAKQIRAAALTIDYDVLHIINHGAFCHVLCTPEFTDGKLLWATFYDHYTQTSSYEQAKLLWEKADRRMVISERLGKKYQEEFGAKPFEIFTDGVYRKEISTPDATTQKKEYVIYFGGLLHFEYIPLFEVLATALDELSKENSSFKVVLRGEGRLDLMNNRTFKTEFRKNFVSDEAIKQEIDEADILYLPIKFSNPEFAKYSLSTKMVGYLGAKGVILYHGPEDSAAKQLLAKHEAAVWCTDMEVASLKERILKAMYDGGQVSLQAKKLVAEQFILEDIQQRFWRQPS